MAISLGGGGSASVAVRVMIGGGSGGSAVDGVPQPPAVARSDSELARALSREEEPGAWTLQPPAVGRSDSELARAFAREEQTAYEAALLHEGKWE